MHNYNLRLLTLMSSVFSPCHPLIYCIADLANRVVAIKYSWLYQLFESLDKFIVIIYPVGQLLT